MKKIFTVIMCAVSILVASAQSPFVVSPIEHNGASIALLGESMSQNLNYVVGMEQFVQLPAAWFPSTNNVMILDGAQSGSFHAVNNAGIAVGELTDDQFISHAIMCNLTGDGSYTTLAGDADDAGASAYGITEDGSIIVGFHFDEAWVTYACIWTNNGTVRTDLPTPTEAEVGFPIDYASARWISADGSVILGYVQDAYSGDWVAVSWKKIDGQYVVTPIANNFYQSRAFGPDGTIVIPENANPYFKFEPYALSANGEWAAISVVPAYDENDFNVIPELLFARLNLVSNELEVVEINDEYTNIEMFGIANDGTCVGRMTGAMEWETFTMPEDAVLWSANTTSLVKVFSLYDNEEYVNQSAMNACTYITADGNYYLGYSTDQNGDQSTFVLQAGNVAVDAHQINMAMYPNPASSFVTVENDNTIQTLTIVNMMGQIVYSENNIGAKRTMVNTQNMPCGMYIVNVVTDNGMVSKRLSIVK